MTKSSVLFVICVLLIVNIALLCEVGDLTRKLWKLERENKQLHVQLDSKRNK